MGAILVAHIMVLGGIVWRESRAVRSHKAVSETVFAIAEVIQARDARDRIPGPDLQLMNPTLQLTAPQEIQFDESIEDELAAVVSPASAPRLARIQSVDPASFARRAHLLAGHVITVVLRVQVEEDGLVSAADVIRPSGNIAADAAAIDYALALHWIPGTNDHKPKSMRVTLPVTLANPSPDGTAPSGPS